MAPVGRQGLPTTHYLLPHERYAANWMLRGQRAHADSKAVKQFQDKWGAEGIVLDAASKCGAILGAPISLVGAGVLVASGGSGAGLVFFYASIGLALCLALLGLIRNRQRVRAVKWFQANRRGVGI
jgi:hypothetical protein